MDNDELLKRSNIRRLREQLAEEAALKKLKAGSKEADEYGDLEFLSGVEETIKDKLKNLPKDEGMEVIEKTLIPYRTPGSVEYRPFKKQNEAEPSIVESFRGETITEARKPKYGYEPTAREILAESSEKAKQRFNVIKNSMGKSKPEEESISRAPASQPQQELNTEGLTDRDIRIGKEWYGANANEYYDSVRLKNKMSNSKK
jgi:hypothetical protein